MVVKPEMLVLMHTRNDCYKANVRIKPEGIMLHSSGANNPYVNRYAGWQKDDPLRDADILKIIGENKFANHWNRPGVKKCGNALVGLDASGKPVIVQTLPWNMRPWLSGRSTKGNANDRYIQWETCQDFGASSKPGTAKTWYWEAVRALDVHMCAWLCQEYGFPVSKITMIDHQEGRKMGIASNHGDIKNWQTLFNDNMDKFRADVQAMLDGAVIPEPVGPVEPPTKDEPIAAAVQTGSSGLNMREGPGTGYKSLGTIPRGKSLDVYEIKGSWARVRYQNLVVWVSANFLTIDFMDTDPEEQPQAPIGIAVQDKSNGLNIRAGRGTNYKSLGLIPRYTDLDVYEIQGTWALVQWGNIQGWVSKNYLTVTPRDE